MVFDFYPWKIEVDVEKTRKFYQENDYSSNKEWNKMFSDILNPLQQDFFDNLGIDLMKIEVVKNEFEDNLEVPFVYSINFLICGTFLSLTKYQLDMYQDEEIFGQSMDLEVIQCIETDRLITYDGLGLSGTGMRFRHPASHFEEQQFQEWNCGFVNGALIVRGR